VILCEYSLLNNKSSQCKICIGFLWGDQEKRKKLHLVNWNTMCNLKKFGELGLRSICQLNIAYMTRANWRFCTQLKQMWTSVIRKKYKWSSSLLPMVNVDKLGSNFWRGLCATWTNFQNQIIWRLGSGRGVEFWKDR